MLKSTRHFVVAAVAALALACVLSSPGLAGVPRSGPGPVIRPNSQWMLNRYYVNQYAYNLRTLGQAYSTVPPWVFGYNPYPTPIYVTPVYPSTPYVYPYYSPFTLYGYPY